MTIQAYLFLVLIANGENVKVVEETNAHASSGLLWRFTRKQNLEQKEKRNTGSFEMMLPDEELAEIRPTYGSV